MIMDKKVDIQHREKDGVLLLNLFAVSLVVSILITWYDFVRWELLEQATPTVPGLIAVASTRSIPLLPRTA